MSGEYFQECRWTVRERKRLIGGYDHRCIQLLFVPMHVNPIMLAADSGAGGIVQLLPFLLIFVVFYFLLIRPQQQQRKKTQEMLGNLKTGDRVVTSGGVYGTVAGFRDGVVQLQVAAQVKIDVARTAIQGLQPAESNGAAEVSQALEKGKKK